LVSPRGLPIAKTRVPIVGTVLTVDRRSVGTLSVESLTFSSAGDTTTAFTITGSAGNDTIVTGDDGSTITGGGGADALTAGSGADIFVYASAADSAADTKVHADTISGFDASADHFDLPDQTKRPSSIRSRSPRSRPAEARQPSPSRSKVVSPRPGGVPATFA